MRHILGALCAASLLVVFLLPAWCSAARSPSSVAQGPRSGTRAPSLAMRIVQVTATPHTVSRNGLITVKVRVQGIRLSYKDIGKRPVAGEGHLQYYLDHIPRDAWSRVDLHHGYLAEAGTPVVTFSLKNGPVKASPGKHRILVALAKDNRMLYHAPVASVTITVM